MSFDIHSQYSRPFKRAHPANATSSALTGRAPQIAAPTGNVFKLADQPGQEVPGRMRLLFIGLGSDNDAFTVAVWAWVRMGQIGAPGLGLYIPYKLAAFGVTVGTTVGVAGSPVLDTERFADTITITSEPTITADTTRGGTVELSSPADNTPAWVDLRCAGAEYLDFDYDQTTGTPEMNTLVQFLAENH